MEVKTNSSKEEYETVAINMPPTDSGSLLRIRELYIMLHKYNGEVRDYTLTIQGINHQLCSVSFNQQELNALYALLDAKREEWLL